MAGEQVDLIGDVLVQQAMRANTDGEEEERMKKLINRDQKQKAVAVLTTGACE